ncbi:MAG: GFA family protein [Burkholderiaceae bacterium]|jgi:hypothetical protein|nr:GFA family protein [Burkholderiaceae bacterium]
MNLSGSCCCGAVTYACSSAPLFTGNCHCRDCQKTSGSAYAPTFFVPEEAITIRGEVKWYERLGDSGKPISRGFCPHCGSQLFGKPSVMPGVLAVRAGTLDDPEQFKPQINIYTRSAPSWDFMDPALPKFPAAPPMKPASKA